MNPTSLFLAIVFTISSAVSAIAGGGACTFQNYATRVLSQSPVLAEFVTSKFTVEDLGKMGPMDAPFDGKRMYTFMEFRATAGANKEQKFIIRIHFKGMDNMIFVRAEFLPLEDWPQEK